jgi:hypothetical protein
MNEMAERRAQETDQEKWNREMGRWAQDAYIRDQEFYGRPVDPKMIQRVDEIARELWETLQDLWEEVADNEGKIEGVLMEHGVVMAFR